MTIRMIHPKHGAMHVYGQGEVDRHIKLGWSVDAPKETIAPAEFEANAEPVKRKPGRPPKAK